MRSPSISHPGLLATLALTKRKAFPSPTRHWIPIAVILVAVIGASLAYLYPSPVEFPMDDAYIHMVYAQNLVERGGLMFNNPDEKGVGVTSASWVLLLAAGYRLGLPLHLVSKALGVASLIGLGVGLYLLLVRYWAALPALMAVLFVILSGHMLWFALSGMETILFLTSGVFAILCYRGQRWVWLGILLGLLTLTRPEGILLAVSVGLVDIWRRKGLAKGLVVAGVVVFLMSLPWYGYLLARTGYLLPTSAIGKRVSSQVGMHLLLQQNEALAVFANYPSLIYPLVWVGYLFEYVLGGEALPPPHLRLASSIAGESYSLSVWAVLGFAAVIAPLACRSSRLLINRFRQPGWMRGENSGLVLVCLIWIALHNLSYMLFLPHPGTASRYGALNHIVLWIVLLAGLFSFLRWRGRFWWLAIGLSVIAVTNTVYWNRVYDANIEHMVSVRIEAARYISKMISDEELCAAMDVGALRFYSQRPVVDLGGLVDPELGKLFLSGDLDRHLVEMGVTCLILPGRARQITDGWFDIAQELGLLESRFVRLRQEKVFEMDRQRWLLGYQPTRNYQATVTIYRVQSLCSAC